jgi:hypothetical protein
MDKEKQIAKRRILQKEKTKVEMESISFFLDAKDRKKLYSGEGFVKVPEEERKRLRVDVYPYLM